MRAANSPARSGESPVFEATGLSSSAGSVSPALRAVTFIVVATDQQGRTHVVLEEPLKPGDRALHTHEHRFDYHVATIRFTYDTCNQTVRDVLWISPELEKAEANEKTP